MQLTNPAGGALDAVLGKARRRWLGLETIQQAAVGVCLALGGAVLLLLAGTQILDWYWPVALFLGACVYGAVRVARRIPSRYEMAQLLDQRLSLHDTLSTAVFFASVNDRCAPAELVRAQRAVAEDLSASADHAMALPLVRPRSAWIAAGLAVVAAGLMAVRYGATGSLDLRAPIVTAEALFSHTMQQQAQKKGPKKAVPEKPFALAVEQGAERPKELDAAQDSVLDIVDVPDVNNEDAVRGRERSDQVSLQAKADPAESEPGSDEGGEQSSGAENATTDPAGRPNAASPQQQAGRQQPPSPEESNLMDKMRDAMANLMAKLKIPPRAGEQGTQAGARSERGESMSRERDPNSRQKGQAGQSQSQAKGTDNDAEGGESDAQQQAQASQGQSSDKGADQGDPSNNKSGMGSQDGEKAIRDAEQMAAMGKISEIFGKRAQSVSGEILVEVTSGKQQLKTAYSQRGGAHAEAGGEISRDEVPLQHRHYVQQYFQELRKNGERSLTPPAAAPDLPPPPESSSGSAPPPSPTR